MCEPASRPISSQPAAGGRLRFPFGSQPAANQREEASRFLSQIIIILISGGRCRNFVVTAAAAAAGAPVADYNASGSCCRCCNDRRRRRRRPGGCCCCALVQSVSQLQFCRQSVKSKVRSLQFLQQTITSIQLKRIPSSRIESNSHVALSSGQISAFTHSTNWRAAPNWCCAQFHSSCHTTSTTAQLVARLAARAERAAGVNALI